MKIGIEAQRLFRPKKHGMDIVIWETLKQLQRIDTYHEFVVFVQPNEDRCLESSSNMKIVEVPGDSYPYWEQVALPLAASREGVDLLHCTSNTAPLYTRIPLILTLHDIIYLEKDAHVLSEGTRYQRLGNLYRKMVVPAAIRKAAHVITVSNYEKQNIVLRTSLSGSRLSVIYNGVHERYEPISHSMVLARTRLKYQLPEAFIFFLGNTAPKKNVYGVIEAFISYARSQSNPMPLVIADFDEEELNHWLCKFDSMDLASYFHLPGYIPNGDMPAVYSLSSVFLYPSLRESFGLPILEAMACGTPVITSRCTAMPEVGGVAAYYVNPYKSDSISRGITDVCSNGALRATMTTKGLRWSKQFSWYHAAQQLLHIYDAWGQDDAVVIPRSSFSKLAYS